MRVTQVRWAEVSRAEGDLELGLNWGIGPGLRSRTEIIEVRKQMCGWVGMRVRGGEAHS